MPNISAHNPSLDQLLGYVRNAASSKPELGVWFEYLAKYALTQDSVWGRRIVRVERYETWANREREHWSAASRQDHGVDLVATLDDGSLIAVQAKGYMDNANGSWEDFAKFVLCADRMGAARKLWITSGKGLSKRARDHNVATDAGVLVLGREWMARATEYPASFAELRALVDGPTLHTPAPNGFRLRHDQEIGVAATVRALATNHSVQFIAACGTGKTVSSFAIFDTLGAKLALFCVPSLALAAQTVRSWNRQAVDSGLHFIAVCSDEELFKSRGDVTGADLGGVVVRSGAALADAIAAGPDGERTVVVSTYQSSYMVVAAQHGFGAAEFPIAFMDEAHYLAGPCKQGEALKDKHDGMNRLRAAKRVYMTATPRTLDPVKAERCGFDSMDAASQVFGPRAYDLPFGEAIQLGILSPYKVSVVFASKQSIAKEAAGNPTVRGAQGDAAFLHCLAKKAVHDLQQAGDTRILTFHSRISDAKLLAEELEAEGISEYARHVDGKMAPRERDERLADLNTRPGGAVITNVGIAKEGIDVPNLHAIIYASPKSSEIDILQSVGRVLRRPIDGDHTAHIVVLVVASRRDLAEIQRSTDSGKAVRQNPRFTTLLNVLRAMSQHDTTMAHEMEISFRSKSPAVRSRGFEHITFDTNMIGAAHRDALLAGVKLAVVRDVAGTWSQRYMALDGWLADHDGVYPTTRSAGERGEVALAKWTQAQRRLYLAAVQDPTAIRVERLSLLADLRGWDRYTMTEEELIHDEFRNIITWAERQPVPHFPSVTGYRNEERALAVRFEQIMSWYRKHGYDIVAQVKRMQDSFSSVGEHAA